MAQGQGVLDKIEAIVPFALPTLGGMAGVIIVNLNPRELYNPMYWIGGGILLGFIASRIFLRLMREWR